MPRPDKSKYRMSSDGVVKLSPTMREYHKSVDEIGKDRRAYETLKQQERAKSGLKVATISKSPTKGVTPKQAESTVRVRRKPLIAKYPK